MRLLIIGSLSGQIGAASRIAIQRGAKVLQAEGITQAMDVMRSGQGADLVMADVAFDIEQLLAEMKSERIHLPVVACGISTDSRAAVAAIKAGAKEYIPLPPDAALIAAVLEAVAAEQDTLIYADPATDRVLQMAKKVAPSPASVLIIGESGTGKELIAKYLHRNSPRKDKPFVAVNCAAIPGELLESELFGHEKGAFTGAVARRIGKFEEASGGTLLLDEISEMDIKLQAKLLRAIQEREIVRIGSNAPVKVDTRILATSNRNMEEFVKSGRFREDLYYRLAVARVHVPPLRERKDDLPLLIEHILATTPGGETASIAQETIDLMMKHDWPGNVRELRNVIERAVLLAETPDSEDSLRRAPAAPSPKGENSGITVTPSQTATSAEASMTVPVDVTQPFKNAKQAVISEFEKRYISRLLAQHDGNISAAARAAGIDRMSIHKMLHRLGLANPGRD